MVNLEKRRFGRGSLVYKLTIRFVLLVTMSTVLVLAVGGWLLNRQWKHSLTVMQQLEAEELAALLSTGDELTSEQIRARMKNHADSDYALYFIQINDMEGRVVFKSANLGDAVIPTANGTHTEGRVVEIIGAGAVGVTEKRTKDWHIFVGSALGPMRHILNEYTRVGIVLIVATALLSLLSGYAFSRMTVEPVRAIEKTARRIRADNLSERIVVPKGYAELAALAELLNQTFDRIETAFAQVRRFSADASHELKTPLALVRLGAEKLRPRLVNDPEADALLADLIEETDHMRRIIDSLLFIAKAEGGALAIQRQPHEMQTLISDFSEDARVLSEDRGVNFSLTRNDAGDALVDRQALRQLLLNLVSNAIAATPKGGLITLSSEQIPDGWRIVLSDEGAGLPEEMLERIFERFTRHHASTTSTGSGLGLAICRSIAGLHGGAIRAENRTDKSGLRLIFEW